MSRIALIEPLGDPGIGTYTHELADAMFALGVDVDVFTASAPAVMSLPRRHRLFPVLDGALIRQRELLRTGVPPNGDTPVSAKRDEPRAPGHASTRRRVGVLRSAAHATYLSIELIGWLRARGYDTLWTQWPELQHRALNVWSAAKAAGMHVVHTAHNVLPHEMSAEDRDSAHVYRRADKIVVHSRMAHRSLARAFPFAAHKLVLARHGLYTKYPRSAEARDMVRAALGIQPGTTLALFFGGVRPYKNVDAVIAALAGDASGSIEVLIAGHESGYPDCDPRDPLGRSRGLIQRAGVADRAHLMPGVFGYAETAALFEAADVVLMPYLKSWGSGLLCLAMSFAKPVIVSRTGGMDEYVEDYQSAVVLDEPTPDAVLAALHQTREQSRAGGNVTTRPAHLEWSSIVRDLVPRILPQGRHMARQAALGVASR